MPWICWWSLISRGSLTKLKMPSHSKLEIAILAFNPLIPGYSTPGISVKQTIEMVKFPSYLSFVCRLPVLSRTRHVSASKETSRFDHRLNFVLCMGGRPNRGVWHCRQCLVTGRPEERVGSASRPSWKCARSVFFRILFLLDWLIILTSVTEATEALKAHSRR